ncbi:MAG: glycyl-radical enzyme activating protein, partial [Youngiibacter sp.]|nr:glycyl-radical enzyme activating protein [Youngiibacter sp.]
GPGVRTSVFFKGCPLSCLWCQNPESNKIRPQLMYDRDTCIGCGKCIVACPRNAISTDDMKVRTDRSICIGCGECVSVCPTKSRSIMGRSMTSDEVYSEVAKDSLFYRNSGGGVTLTGGEVLYQSGFAKDILRKCMDNNIHTAIETCGFASWKAFSEVLPYVDLVIYDLKHMDTYEHKKGTGAGNEQILDNLARISAEMSIPVIVRTPIIPGYNDTEENAHRMAKFISEKVRTCQEVNLLPYHNLGDGKKSQLEEKLSFSSKPPGIDELERLKSIIRSYGIEVK